MGGRGSYSMSFKGRGVSFASVGDWQIGLSSVESASDDTLHKVEASLRAEMEAVGERMLDLVYEANGRGDTYPGEKYYELQDRRDELRDEINRIEDELLSRRKDQDVTSRSFVNSYGEATRRYVTTQVYENSQRRMRKAVESFLGKR